MASHYINCFVGKGSRKKVLNVVDDFYEIDTLQHYLDAFVRKDKQDDYTYDWKRKYRTKGYMNMLITEYIEYVKILKDVEGLSEVKSEKVAKRRQDVLDMFYKKNRWNSLFKNFAKYRKLFGDVYIYWYIEEDARTKIKYPKLKILDSKCVKPMIGEDGEIHAYEYERTAYYMKQEMNNNTKEIEFVEKSKAVRWVFTEDGQHIYEDGQYVRTIPATLSGRIPIIHLQYMREEKDDSPYSEIPTEPIIDICLALDFLETSLSQTNAISGAPQMVVIDGLVSPDSMFGPNGIIYVETKNSGYTMNDDDEMEYNPGADNGVKQAKVTQLEITNGLKSLTDQMDGLVDALYTKANLIPPRMLEKLSSSDSSKVINAIKLDLEQEVQYFYEEVAEKMEVIMTELFIQNNLAKKTDRITFELPETALNATIFDKYLLKAQKMELGELTMKGNLRKLGYTEKEITAHMKELNDEQYEKNKDKSSAGGNVAKGPQKELKDNKNTPNQYEKKGVDNNLKNKVKKEGAKDEKSNSGKKGSDKKEESGGGKAKKA